MSDRTRSHLLKAQQLFDGIARDTLRSVQLTQAQDAAEHAFRAVLFGMSITRINDHELHRIAKDHQHQLNDIWPRLSPLLQEYEWLLEWRNIARYKHVDVPEYSDPEITDEMVERAKHTARNLIDLAETLI
jgi:HEPN domain-containing protein